MDKLWGKMTQSILENNHIRIPIHKRFFLSFIEGDETNISKEKLLHDLDKHGFIEDDPRLLEFRKKLNIIIKTSSINYDEFTVCIQTNLSLLQKIFQESVTLL